jgi:hypothetical protein
MGRSRSNYCTFLKTSQNAFQFMGHSVFETFFSIHRTEPGKFTRPMPLFTHSPLLRSEIESYTIVKSLPCNQDHASLS